MSKTIACEALDGTADCTTQLQPCNTDAAVYNELRYQIVSEMLDQLKTVVSPKRLIKCPFFTDLVEGQGNVSIGLLRVAECYICFIQTCRCRWAVEVVAAALEPVPRPWKAH